VCQLILRSAAVISFWHFELFSLSVISCRTAEPIFRHCQYRCLSLHGLNDCDRSLTDSETEAVSKLTSEMNVTTEKRRKIRYWRPRNWVPAVVSNIWLTLCYVYCALFSISDRRNTTRIWLLPTCYGQWYGRPGSVNCNMSNPMATSHARILQPRRLLEPILCKFS